MKVAKEWNWHFIILQNKKGLHHKHMYKLGEQGELQASPLPPTIETIWFFWQNVQYNAVGMISKTNE